MAAKTLQQAQAEHEAAVAANQEAGVVTYESEAPVATDVVYEVTEGYKYLPGGKRLGPGQRFHPTRRQVESGSLKGKARELTASEYRDLRHRTARTAVQGADIGLRRFPMAEGTLRRALEAGLTEADFEGTEPQGQDGQYTRRQVDDMIAERAGGEPRAA